MGAMAHRGREAWGAKSKSASGPILSDSGCTKMGEYTPALDALRLPTAKTVASSYHSKQERK